MAIWVILPATKKRTSAGGGIASRACLLSIAEHRALCEAYEARLAGGAPPGKAWRDAMAAARVVPAWILSCMVEVERRRLASGVSMELFSEEAGLADKGYNKPLRPWCNGGRVPVRSTLEVLAWAVGFKTLDDLKAAARSRAMTRGEYASKLLRLAERHGRAGKRRARMCELSPLGVAGRKAKLTPHQRSAIAALGAIALNAKRTPEQRSASVRAINASRTPAERSAAARVAAIARWS